MSGYVVISQVNSNKGENYLIIKKLTLDLNAQV